MCSFRTILLAFCILPLCLTGFFSCGNDENVDASEAARAEAEAFAADFCLFRFDMAAARVLPQAEAFLKIYASNLTQADMDALVAQTNAPEVRNVSIRLTSDSTAQATCRLRNVYVADTIGSVGRFEKDATMLVDLLLVDSAAVEWRVRTASLPRSGK